LLSKRALGAKPLKQGGHFVGRFCRPARAQRSGNPYPSAAIKQLLLTGYRRGEIVNLRWNHVDFERECLRLPDSKTGAKVVYLNTPARILLQELPRMADNPRVIPGMRADSASAAIENAWERVRAAADLIGVRPIFRRSKATIRGGEPTKRPSSMLKRP
jgi:integrase